MAAESEVIFPRALSDIYPVPAQYLYIETYKKSLATSVAGTSGSLSPESVAARDAWDAVRREFMQDPVTHKWRRIADQVAAEPTRTGKRSFLGTVKGMFKR